MLVTDYESIPAMRNALIRLAPVARSRSIRPAFPRKISGDALTTRTSGISQLSGEILLVDDEHVDAASR